MVISYDLPGCSKPSTEIRRMRSFTLSRLSGTGGSSWSPNRLTSVRNAEKSGVAMILSLKVMLTVLVPGFTEPEPADGRKLWTTGDTESFIWKMKAPKSTGLDGKPSTLVTTPSSATKVQKVASATKTIPDCNLRVLPSTESAAPGTVYSKSFTDVRVGSRPSVPQKNRTTPRAALSGPNGTLKTISMIDKVPDRGRANRLLGPNSIA
mmetsp:Transcript_53410/g.124351  ORF Transcript_53410/g.124351 Transcript_53410/m.124351 type:complete len:208 (+) Transcript_53410:848-1471(+)